MSAEHGDHLEDPFNLLNFTVMFSRLLHGRHGAAGLAAATAVAACGSVAAFEALDTGFRGEEQARTQTSASLFSLFSRTNALCEASKSSTESGSSKTNNDQSDSSVVVDESSESDEKGSLLSRASRTKVVSGSKDPHLCSVNNDFTPGCGELKVFAGNSNRALAEEISGRLGVTLGKSKASRFADGEVSVKIDESVRGKDVYIVQSTSPPVNENLMELLLMVSAARHASAKKVTVVVPYFGYMRSLAHSAPTKSRTDWNYARSNLAAADVARMMEVAGAQSVIAIDIHPPGQGMAEGFFQETPIETLRAADFVPQELASTIRQSASEQGLVVVSPHASCLTKAKHFKVGLSEALDLPIGLATIIRTPPPPSMDGSPQPRSVDLVGNVKDKSVLIVEDIMESGSTTCAAVDALIEAGAKDVTVYCSHALFNKGAAQRLADSPILKIVVLNTVPVSKEDKEILGDKLHVISVAPMVADLIRKMHYETK